MGLRINTNTSALRVLMNLRTVDSRREKLFEQLSSGLRINQASDDPFGMVMSERLRSQVTSLQAASENNSNSANMLNTADAALAEVHDLLTQIRVNLVSAANLDAISPDAVAAEQAAVDAALDSIDRIASTTRFNGRDLLNGSSSIEVDSFDTAGILEVRPQAARLNPVGNTSQFRLDVTQVAEQAEFQIGSSVAGSSLSVSGGDITVRLSGPNGTIDLDLQAGLTVSEVEEIINDNRDFTGVYAQNGMMYTEQFGSQADLSLTIVRGSGQFEGGDPSSLGLAVGENATDFGVDAEATLNGESARGIGNQLNFVGTAFSGVVELNPVPNEDATNPPGGVGTYSFELRNSGVRLQLGSEVESRQQRVVNLPGLDPSRLGGAFFELGGIEFGGALSSLHVGEANDLYNNVDNAMKIVDDAIDEVSAARGQLGSIVSGTIESTLRTNQVAVENISASESAIRDLDFAEAASRATREQVLFEASVSVLSQANLVPQSILRILAG